QARIEAVLRRSLATSGLQAPGRTAPRRDPHLLVPADVVDPIEETRPTPQKELEWAWHSRTPRLGQRLRQARQERDLTLHQVERVCNIRWEFLQAIEQDNFSYLPRQELRRALKVYAAYLDVDLRDQHGRPYAVAAPISRQQHFAILMTLMVVLIAVGIYLL
ncbi:MAG TPA: helix-turn-helix domain-containing protein, partial [Roseiflexaceae bacterium]|nr:helix-turn-helix domain-containing protein [Roseiflexaceae bacterium]